MPMQRDLYPENWEAIALAVKDEAKWTCEQCGRPCRRPGESPLDFMARIATGKLSECRVIADYLEAPTRYTLTVSHTDHRPENCDRNNLRALCAPCHCRYDNRPEQRAIKKRLKQERLGQLSRGV